LHCEELTHDAFMKELASPVIQRLLKKEALNLNQAFELLNTLTHVIATRAHGPIFLSNIIYDDLGLPSVWLRRKSL